MKNKIKLLIIINIFLLACNNTYNVNEPHRESNQIAFEKKKIDGTVFYYALYNEKKHGYSIQVDSLNRPLAKMIYYKDTLMQSKEYYWSEGKIDSICYFTYNYKQEGVVFKEFYLKYPDDTVFFMLKFKPIYKENSYFNIELIGEGLLSHIPNSDTIYKENYLKHYDRMITASDYLRMEQYYPIKKDSLKNTICHSFSFGMIINNGRYEYLKRQIKVYFVPLFTEDTALVNTLSKYDITF